VTSRDLEVDVLCALERLPFVTQVLLHDDAGPGAVRFCVVLRPYAIGHLVEAHYTLLAATSHEVTGRVLYVDPDGGLPPLVARMRPLGARPEERANALARAAERAKDALWLARLEEAAAARAAMEEGLRRQTALTPIVASMQSGVFEVVPDPFPSPTYTVLVADPDPTSALAVRALPRVSVTEVEDGWAALDALTGEAMFDLALCAVALAGCSGAKVYRMVAEARPEAAARIVFVADRTTVDSAPPSAARTRVLSRPVDAEAVKFLLERWRERSH
jgi:CheY-like chemotaxis protein